MAGGNPLSMGRDVAVDLGTANTLVYVKGQGLVLNEPSMVAVDTRSGQVVAVGHEAKRMWGRAPKNIRLVRPLKDGVIADFDVCEQMLKQFLQRISTVWEQDIWPQGSTGSIFFDGLLLLKSIRPLHHAIRSEVFGRS
jgi:actin-like ATPase involved in cell morphogenesis